MKAAIYCLLSFILGVTSMAVGAQYASQVWAYDQLSRSREALMLLAFNAYKQGRVKEAAALARGANRIAGLKDHEWKVTSPITDTVFRWSGTFSAIHVSPNYNAYLVAYLYRRSGETRQAQRYYAVCRARGVSKAKADESAQLLLRAMSSSSKGRSKMKPK